MGFIEIHELLRAWPPFDYTSARGLRTGRWFSLSLASFVALLVLGDGATQAVAVHSRPIEAARTALSLGEHVAGGRDPLHSSLGPLGGGDPMNEIPARGRRDVRPRLPSLCRGGRERLPQIGRHLRLRLLRHRRNFQGDNVARLRARRSAKLAVYLEPVASLAIRRERGLKGRIINSALNGRLSPRRELRAGLLGQGQKGPG